MGVGVETNDAGARPALRLLGRLAQQPGHERGQARAAGAHLLLQNLRAVFDVGEVALTADAPEDACTEPVAAQDVEDPRQPAAVECRQERADPFDGLVGRGVPEPVEVRAPTSR